MRFLQCPQRSSLIPSLSKQLRICSIKSIHCFRKNPLPPPKLTDQDVGYARYQKLLHAERLPYLMLFANLYSVLNRDKVTQLVEQYRALQARNSPNLSDIIAISEVGSAECKQPLIR